MASKTRSFEFARYPKYKALYIRAFDRMLAERVRKGRTAGSWGDGTTTGEDIFHWWMEDGILPGQINMEDLMGEMEDEE